MPEFKDLNSDGGLAALNTYLASRSYLDGYKPSQQDVAVFSNVGNNIDCTKYPHIARWHSHIGSFPCKVKRSWGGQVHLKAKKEEKAPASTAKAPAKSSKKEEVEEEEEEESAMSFDDLGAADSDDDDESSRRIQEIGAAKRAADEAAGKKVIARSTLILDVKPEEDTTDLKQIFAQIQQFEIDGLVWKPGHDFVKVAFGIFKLRIMCAIEDAKVMVDDVVEKIEAIEGVQSVDIHSFNKI